MKLGVKLMLAFLLIVAVTITTATLYSTAAISHSFQSYMQHSFSLRTEIVAASIVDYYKINGWQGMQDYMQGSVRGRGPGMGMGFMMNNRRLGMGMDRYLIADETGMVIADTYSNDRGKILGTEQLTKGQPLIAEGRTIGTMISYSGSGQLEDAFASSVRRANTIAGIVALLLSLAVAFYLSRKISRPLVALSEGAKRVAGRDLSFRISGFSNDEIGIAAQSFNQMAEKLKQNEQLRKNMLADIAHELRTPLSILRGNLESLQEGVIQPKTEVFASLHEETVRMTRLVSDLQELALAEAGELKLNIQSVLLPEIVAGIYANLALDACRRGITLQTEIPDQMEVMADGARLEQVLYNLLTNSFKNTPCGGTVKIIGRMAAGQAEIAVEDSGSGIGIEDLPYIFDRFYRSDKSRNRETGGAGLGLAITKGLVEAQGGRVWAESQIGQGSRFVFTIPLGNLQA